MEITNLIVGPVGNVPMDYVYDFNNPEHHSEFRDSYTLGISSLMVNICDAVDKDPGKVIIDISDLSVVDNPEEDEYSVVIPKIAIHQDLAAITMFYHKNINKEIYDVLLKIMARDVPNARITDFDILSTYVCLSDSKSCNFGIITEFGTYQVDCAQVDDVIFYVVDEDGRKGKFCLRIIGIPDKRNQNGEYEYVATLISAMPKEIVSEIAKSISNLKTSLSPNALSYVMMSKGPKDKFSNNCFDVNYFRAIAKQCLDFLVLSTEGNNIN